MSHGIASPWRTGQQASEARQVVYVSGHQNPFCRGALSFYRDGFMVPRDVRVQLDKQLIELANSYCQHYGSKHEALSALGEDLLRLADRGVNDGSSSWVSLIQELCRRSG